MHVLLQTVGNASNPLEPYFASVWNYMTDNYSRFTIAMWISVALHEVRTCRAGSLRYTVRPSTVGCLLWFLCTRVHCPVSTLHAKTQSTAGIHGVDFCETSREVTCHLYQDKPETFDMQWKCFRKLMFNHFCIQVQQSTL